MTNPSEGQDPYLGSSESLGADRPASGDYATQGDLTSATYGTGTPTTGYASTGYSTQGESASTTDVAKQEAGNVAGTAKQEAGNVRDTAVSAGQNVAATAKDEAKNVVAETKQQAQSLLGSVTAEVKDQASNQQQKLATAVHSLSKELGSMASNSTESGPLTDLAHQASARGGEIAHWLENREPRDVLEEVKRFARRRPVLFLGICAAAGVVAGRLTRGAIAANTSLDSGDRGTRALPSANYATGYRSEVGQTGYATPDYSTTGYAETAPTRSLVEEVPADYEASGTISGGPMPGYDDPARPDYTR